MIDALNPSLLTLEAELRGNRGAPCTKQAETLAALLKRLGPTGTGPMPSLAEIAREMGTVRQVVATAIDRLRAKGFVAITPLVPPIVQDRRQVTRQLTMTMPDRHASAQLALPF